MIVHWVSRRLQDCLTNLYTLQLASPAISDGLCAHLPNPSRNELEKWQKLLSERILGAGQEYRLNIDKLLEEMNQGNGFGENGKICKLTHIPQSS